MLFRSSGDVVGDSLVQLGLRLRCGVVAGVAGALSNPGCGGSAEPVRNRSAGGLTMGDIGWGSERTVGFQCVQSAVVHTRRQEDVVVDSGSSGDLFGWWGLCLLYGLCRAMQWAEWHRFFQQWQRGSDQ